ncbi:MAG: hypothetical protein WDZ35_08125 [Crocinitomicaceae bacterium]
MKKIYWLNFFLLLLHVSCKKDDTTPSWLVIEDIELSTNEVTEGENSDNITDAWVYMDNQALGVFELPARIPVLAEGTHDFTIYAGIKVNGISATRTRYPFYERYDASIHLVKNEEVSISPVISYKSNIQFELLEDFEDVGIDFNKTYESDTAMVTIDKSMYPDIVKYGNHCGAVYLNQLDSLFKAVTSANLKLPKSEDVYVEIDYMNNNSIALGVVAQNSGGSAEHTPLVIMNSQPTEEMKWKKIHINLKDDVSSEINATSFEIYLISILDAENSEAVIYLDNIKVIRYE